MTAILGHKALYADWTGTFDNKDSLSVKRALKNVFTLSLVTSTVKANIDVFNTGNIKKPRSYHFRAQVYNNVGTSAWVNTYRIPKNIP